MASRFPKEWRTVDYYVELGVPTDATTDDVTRRYRALAKQLHPDVRPDDPAAAARFTRVSAANEVLSDPGRRRDYDSYRRALRGDDARAREARAREARFRATTGTTAGSGGTADDLAVDPSLAPVRRAEGGLFGFFGEFARHHPLALGTVVLMVLILVVSAIATSGHPDDPRACQLPTTQTLTPGGTVYTPVRGRVVAAGSPVVGVRLSNTGETVQVPDAGQDPRAVGDNVVVLLDPQGQPAGFSAACPDGTTTTAVTAPVTIIGVTTTAPPSP